MKTKRDDALATALEDYFKNLDSVYAVDTKAGDDKLKSFVNSVGPYSKPYLSQVKMRPTHNPKYRRRAALIREVKTYPKGKRAKAIELIAEREGIPTNQLQNWVDGRGSKHVQDLANSPKIFGETPPDHTE